MKRRRGHTVRSNDGENGWATCDGPARPPPDWLVGLALLRKTHDVFARLAQREPSRMNALKLAEALGEMCLGAANASDPWKLGDAFAAAGHLVNVARHRRPGNANLKTAAAEDLSARCARLATQFAFDAWSALHGGVPPGKEREALRADLERAEHTRSPELRKRIAFLELVARTAFTRSRIEERGARDLDPGVTLALYMRDIDVEASLRVTDELARAWIAAWRKRAGQRGKWEALAKACEHLGLGQPSGKELSADTLKQDWRQAVERGDARNWPRPAKRKP